MLGHGRFLAWIEAEFTLPDRAARRFIAVAERFACISDTASDVPATVLYELAAPSTPREVREAVVERTAAGKKVTANTMPGDALAPPPPRGQCR